MTDHLVRAEHVPTSTVLARITEALEALEAGDPVAVPKVHEREAEFRSGRWVMPRDAPTYDAETDVGRRLLGILRAVKHTLEADDVVRRRQLWYSLDTNHGVFRSRDGPLADPYATFVERYLPRVEGLLGAERESFNVIGEGRGWLWAPDGRMSTPERSRVRLSSAPAIRRDVRDATFAGHPDTVLSVEKGGLFEVLADTDVPEVLDLMLVVPKGRTNREALRLLRDLEREGRTVVTLNDGDVAGLCMPQEMQGGSRKSAHLGDDFRPNPTHLGLYGRALERADVPAQPEDSNQLEDAMEKARHLGNDHILAELEHIAETGLRWEVSALDGVDRALQTYIVEAFRVFGIYDARLFDPSTLAPREVRETAEDLGWNRIDREADVDADELAYGEAADVLCIDVEPDAKAAYQRRRTAELDRQATLPEVVA